MDVDRIFDGSPVTLEDVLQCRSDRARRQRELLTQGFPCLISFTLNIPGPVKQFSMARMAFQEGLNELHRELSGHIVHQVLTDADTGSEALLCVERPPQQVKARTAALEEYHPLGRLFDMDVLDAQGESLSRVSLGHPRRRCLLCGQDAKVCARSRAHSPESIRLAVAQLLDGYFRDQAADGCAACATRALLYEVSTTPKPGLVDRLNSGSHRDMDFFTFLDSSAALSPWFREMFCLGWNSAGRPAEELFRQLRFSGQQAEQAMYTATGGVNTHKGLIFSLGILCGALGAAHSGRPIPVPMEQVLQLCRELGQCSLSDFSSAPAQETSGLRCFHAHQITGARGQAAQGFPAAVEIGLPSLRKWTARGLSLNDAGAMTLAALLAETEDTNMIHRGGLARAEKCRKDMDKLIPQLTADNVYHLLSQLDRQYIEANLSPGGCADLLALSFFLFFLEQQGYLSF